MRLHKDKMGLIAVALLAGCSFGPRLKTAMPEVRDVPILANLSPQESLARGRSFLASKQYGLAIELFKGASRNPALEVDSLNGLAIAYDAIGRHDLAERYFQRALAANPADGRVRRNLAALYASTGQRDKRRALLAGPAEPAPEPPVADAALAASSLEGAIVPSRAALEARSPLGGALDFLLVNAAMPVPPNTASSAGAVVAPRDGATILCVSTNGAPLPPSGEAPLQLFRVSMGEVFVAAKPAGATCFIEGDSPAAIPPADAAAMSNKDYLGMVAAYLDRLNRGDVQAIDIAALWRAAFWPGAEA